MSEQTYEAILKREMARVPGDLDTREGSLIWYANAPGAVELVNLNIAVEEALNNGFADTASRKYLIRRAAERGLSPQAASAAILELTTTPAEIEILHWGAELCHHQARRRRCIRDHLRNTGRGWQRLQRHLYSHRIRQGP